MPIPDNDFKRILLEYSEQKREIAKLKAALELIADLYGYEAEANAVAIARKALAKAGK